MNLSFYEKIDSLNKHISEHKFDQALHIIHALEAKNNDSQQLITLQIAKTKVMNEKDDFQDSLALSEKTLDDYQVDEFPDLNIDLLIEKIKSLRRLRRFEESLETISQVELILQKQPLSLEISKKKASLLYLKGENLHAMHNSTQGLKIIEQSLALREEIKDTEGIGWSLYYLGIIYHETSKDVNLAIDFFKKSLALFQEINYKFGAAQDLYNISWIYREKGELDLSLKYALQNLKYRKELGTKKAISWAFTNIGLIHGAKEDFEQSIGFLKKSLSIQQETNNQSDIAWTLYFMGTILKQSGDLDSALDYSFQGLSIFKELDIKLSVSRAHFFNGRVYQIQGETTKAFDSYNQCLDLREEIGNALFLSFPLFRLVLSAIDLKDRKKSLDYVERLKQICNEKKNDMICTQFKVANVLANKSDIKSTIDKLEEILTHEINDPEIYIIILFEIVQLSLNELSELESFTTSHDSEMATPFINQIFTNLNLIHKAAENNNLSLILMESLRLHGSIALVLNDNKKAEKLFAKALQIEQKNKLFKFIHYEPLTHNDLDLNSQQASFEELLVKLNIPESLNLLCRI